MKCKTAFAFLLATSCFAWADQVTLKNGDKITGSIIKKDGGNLVLKSAAAGPITIPWDQVDSISSDGPLSVVLAGDKTVQSTLSTSAGRVMVQGNGVAPADIVAIRNADEQAAFERLEHPGWGQLWAGTASLSFAGTTGNSETKSFLVNANVARITRTDKASIYFTAIKSSATIDNVSSDTAEAVRGGWGYSRNLGPKMFVNVFNDWEYDKFQDLDLRFVIGGGAGYHLWKTDKGELDLEAGVDYDRDKFGALVGPPVVAALTNNRAELYYGDDFAYKMSATTAITESAKMFHDFSDFGSYRLSADLGVNTKITKWLTWTVSLSDRYLAVPVLGRKANDFIYATGLGVTFAR